MRNKILFILVLSLFVLKVLAQDTNKTISGGVLNSKATFLAKPDYSEEAKAAGADGQVNVQVKLDEEGKIVSAKAISGNQFLWQAAEEAALKSKFTPTFLHGEAVKINGVIIYNFVSYRVNWFGFGKAVNATRIYDNLKLEPAADFLNKDYETEKNQLLSLDSDEKLSRTEVIDRVISSIRRKLPAKEIWYFEVGMALTEVNLSFNTGKVDYENLKESLSKLKNLSAKAPEGVPTEMSESVKNLGDYVVNPALSYEETRKQLFMLERNISQYPK